MLDGPVVQGGALTIIVSADRTKPSGANGLRKASALLQVAGGHSPLAVRRG